MSLFPVKVRALFKSLANEGVLDRLFEGAALMPVNSPKDGHPRIALCSRGVLEAAERDIELAVRKLRLVVPRDVNPLYLAESILVECYDDEDNTHHVAFPLSAANGHLSFAIEAELYSLLLGAKGIHIPMYE